MQHIPYIPKYTSNQPFKNDFTQSFSLAFIIRKNALILYSFSEEKEVQNGLFYHFIYKTLVVNWSNMLHRQITPHTGLFSGDQSRHKPQEQRTLDDDFGSRPTIRTKSFTNRPKIFSRFIFYAGFFLYLRGHTSNSLYDNPSSIGTPGSPHQAQG